MENKEPQKLLPEGKKSAAAQWVWAIIVVLVLLGAGYYLVHNKAQEPAASATGEEVATTTGDMATTPAATHSYEWAFQIVGGDAQTGADKSQVTLTYDGTSKDAGTYEGHCSVIGADGSAWPLMPNELTGVICWWAGAGDEVGVFLENGARVVKHGTLDEGSAEVPGTRGGYTTLFTL